MSARHESGTESRGVRPKLDGGSVDLQSTSFELFSILCRWIPRAVIWPSTFCHRHNSGKDNKCFTLPSLYCCCRRPAIAAQFSFVMFRRREIYKGGCWVSCPTCKSISGGKVERVRRYVRQQALGDVLLLRLPCGSFWVPFFCLCVSVCVCVCVCVCKCVCKCVCVYECV